MRAWCLLLLACQAPVETPEPEPQAPDNRQAIIDGAAANLRVPSFATMKLSLPTNVDGVTVAWMSSDPAIAPDGSVAVPQCNSVMVTLTATLTYRGLTQTRAFTVTVGPTVADQVNNASITFTEIAGDNTDAMDVHANLELPDTLACGVAVTWASDSPYISNSGVVVAPFDAPVDVTLTATLSKDGFSKTIPFALHINAGAFNCPAWVIAGSHDVGDFAFGNGTSGNPFWSCTRAHLDHVRNHSDANHRVGADISADNWTAIDDFTGSISGGTVRGLTMASGGAGFNGFFKVLHGSVSEMRFEDAAVAGDHHVGIIAGQLQSGGSIDNVTLTGAVTGANNDVGGAVGGMSGPAQITRVHSSLRVASGGDGVGGIVAETNTAPNAVSGCVFDGVINARAGTNIGGIAGRTDGDTLISRCTASGVIAGANDAGGIVGNMSGVSLVERSVFSGSVSVLANDAGGIAGSITQAQPGGGPSIDHCLSHGAVLGDVAVGGVVGQQNGGRVANTWTDAQVVGRVNVGGLVGRSYSGANVHENQARACMSFANVTVSGFNGGGMYGALQVAVAGTSSVFDVGGVVTVNAVSGATAVGTFVGTLAQENALTLRLENTYVVGVTGFAGDVYGAPTGVNNYCVGVDTFATGKPAGEMNQQGTYAGFDFVGVWLMDMFPRIRGLLSD